MKKPPLLRVLIVLGVLASGAVRLAAATIVERSDGSYTATREAATTFNRDVDKLADAAKDDATEFCAKKGLRPKFVSITVDKPWIALGIPKAVVVFKALEPGDPELADPEPVAVTRKGKKSGKAEAAVGGPPPPAPTDELYSALLKLDDLRKKGILTEDEFQAEKKKVLERSK